LASIPSYLINHFRISALGSKTPSVASFEFGTCQAEKPKPAIKSATISQPDKLDQNDELDKDWF